MISLKKLLGDLMAAHFKLLCLQATWRALTDKNWANRTMNLGLSKRAPLRITSIEVRWLQ
jgi:hypothetical protein